MSRASHRTTPARCALFEKLVEPMFEKIFKDVEDKTSVMLALHQHGHPITYNHDFTKTVQEGKKEGSRVELTNIINDAFGVDLLYSHPLLCALMAHNNLDICQNACSNALYCMQAYYRVGLFFHHFTKASSLE